MRQESFVQSDRPALAVWAAACAAHVLCRFEKTHPHDSRPRRAIAAARLYARGKSKVGPARTAALAAHAAARDAKDPPATFAARAAAHAAGTAHMAGHAVHAGAYARKAARDANKERAWQRRCAPARLRRKLFAA